MPLNAILGHDEEIAFLDNAVKNGRIAPAYLFVGPEGIGKKLVAVRFAQALNCLSPVNGTPCGACRPCANIAAGSYPDVGFYKSDKDSGLFGIDTVRDLRQAVSLKPYEGKRKVFIVDALRSFTDAAANAFLKTLEEPPPDTVIIMIVRTAGGLPGTMISRSVSLRFRPLSRDIVERILVRDHGFDAASARSAAFASGGSLSVVTGETGGKFAEERRHIIDEITTMALFDKEPDGGARQIALRQVDELLIWYRDMMLVKLGIEEARFLVNGDRITQLSAMSERLTLEKIYGSINDIIATREAVSRSANLKLAMAVLGLRIGS